MTSIGEVKKSMRTKYKRILHFLEQKLGKYLHLTGTHLLLTNALTGSKDMKATLTRVVKRSWTESIPYTFRKNPEIKLQIFVEI